MRVVCNLPDSVAEWKPALHVAKWREQKKLYSDRHLMLKIYYIVLSATSTFKITTNIPFHSPTWITKGG